MRTLITDLAFPEGPRWRGSTLFFSDVHSHRVLAWDGTSVREIAEVPGRPSGIGFLDDRHLLVASQDDRVVMKVDLQDASAAPTVHADLSELASWHLNDMITDAAGRAYVGNYGSDAPPGVPIAPAELILVETDGTARVVASDLFFPNGMAFRNGGRQLVVAETRSEPGRLTVFDVEPDGSLTNRQVVVEFATEWPDGIAVDAQDCIWVASPFSAEVIRVSPSGEVLERMPIDDPYAVALGGPDGRDLFVCTSGTWLPEQAAVQRSGAIRVLRVEVPAA